MFGPGSIHYIENWEFAPEDTKNKYLLTLFPHSTSSFIGCLTTTVERIPYKLIDRSSPNCVKSEDLSLNAFFFPTDIPICENGYSFPADTQVHFGNRNTFPFNPEKLIDKYGQNNVHHRGTLSEHYLKEICYCAYSGRKANIRRDLHHLIETFLDHLFKED